MKEYIVSLKRDVNYDAFWSEIENEFPNDGFVPERRVDIVNNRDASLRQCHYALTDEEAEKLRQDPRVYAVDLPTKFKPMKSATQVGNFTKTTSDTGDYVNWALRRCIETNNPYGIDTTVEGGYTFCLDGSGVDIVIQDSGIEADHPEFQDANGNSRVQLIDWFAASGVTGTMPENHYNDTDGHGTHVAGIAAGKTYGWAKNANIYSVKVDGLDGGEGGGLNPDDGTAFDVIIGWHNAKRAAGNNRPTIVNMSWGYNDYFYNINGGAYRGNPWTGNTRRTDYGMIGQNVGTGLYAHGVRVSYIDVSIQEMIDAGIHVCIAAGNSSQFIEFAWLTDYNNYYNGGYFNAPDTPNYYHRGSSPYDDEAFIVGSLDSTVYDATHDQKSTFSNTGYGVNIWAPGSNVMSCTSYFNNHSGATYHLDPSYRQVNISGTSMASPQVCGVGALLLQMTPALTPAQLKSAITKASTTAMYDPVDSAYTNTRALLGSEKRVLYNPYNASTSAQINFGRTS